LGFEAAGIIAEDPDRAAMREIEAKFLR